MYQAPSCCKPTYKGPTETNVIKRKHLIERVLGLVRAYCSPVELLCCVPAATEQHMCRRPSVVPAVAEARHYADVA